MVFLGADTGDAPLRLRVWPKRGGLALRPHDPELETPAHEQESVFFRGVVWVVVYERALVKKCRLRLLKGDSVLAAVGAVLGLIPLEAQYNYNIMFS
jgi:hypothetical protein